MRPGELDKDPFGKDQDEDEDEDDEESEDRFELEIPQLEAMEVTMMENGIVRRDTRNISNGNIPGLGHRFFTTWGSNGVILY